MADVVFLLGASFSCSVADIDFGRKLAPPLASNFFQMLIGAGRLREQPDGIRRHVYVDELFARIDRYWHLSLDDLATHPFDIEECLTLLESQAIDFRGTEEGLGALRAAFALRALLLGYLSDMSLGSGYSPTARCFGEDVLRSNSDVLTFNYDTLAEGAISSASGIGPNPRPPSHNHNPLKSQEEEVPEDSLGSNHLAWKRTLGFGFEFDEVALPVAGVSRYVGRKRYYGHPENKLYDSHRVLKLHGSIDWLRYTPRRAIPEEFAPESPTEPPDGLIQESYAHWWMGEPPRRGHWYMDPEIVPPQLYKEYQKPPFPTVWAHAIDTLSSCRSLVVIGYSFPPTDFRTRRLFLEAFSGDHRLERLVVVNPDSSTVAKIRDLTHFSGPVVICDDLSSYYGVSKSWFPKPNDTSQS